jgi:hypothetical protein
VEVSRSHNKAITFKPSLNKSTGKLSTTALSFNEANWGKTTREYIKSVQQLKPECFKAIMSAAVSFSKASTKTIPDSQQATTMGTNSVDIRACLVDLCDDDGNNSEANDDCKSPLFSF